MPDVSTKRKRKRRTLPSIFAELPMCSCGSVAFTIDGGTVKSPDGSKCQYATCVGCGEGVKIVWEIPPGGLVPETLPKMQERARP